MKTILLASLFVVSALGTSAFADPTSSARTVVATAESPRPRAMEREEIQAFVALNDAREQVATARAHWDAAVAGGHPKQAGRWARRHFEAMQVRNAAVLRWDAAVERVNGARYATR